MVLPLHITADKREITSATSFIRKTLDEIAPHKRLTNEEELKWRTIG